MEKPSLAQIESGRGVLVKVLRVGVDGTDKEINAAEYGTAPEGFNFLVVGQRNSAAWRKSGQASPNLCQATMLSPPSAGPASACTILSAVRT